MLNNNFRENGIKGNCKSKVTWWPGEPFPSLLYLSLSHPLQDHPSPQQLLPLLNCLFHLTRWNQTVNNLLLFIFHVFAFFPQIDHMLFPEDRKYAFYFSVSPATRKHPAQDKCLLMRMHMLIFNTYVNINKI